jgi:sodium transport system permease protein
MNPGTIATVYLKELRDSLRDRRTLYSSILIPTFLMPMLVIGVLRVASVVVQKARAEVPAVMVIGGADSPSVRAEMKASPRFRAEPAAPDWKAEIAEKRVRAAAEIPPGFQAALESGSAPAVTLYHYEGELKSGLAVEQLRDFFTDLRERASARLLRQRGVPPTLARPFEVREANVAPPEKVGGNMLGGLVPYIIILICFTGAFNPAVDLTAGEKERGTMETLLCCPAARTDIVLGKFCMVLTGSVMAVICSLVSMGATVALVGGALGGRAPAPGALGPTIDPLGILGVLAMVIPVAVLFSAVLFTVSLFAKTFREAQSYAAPMILLVILPLIVGMLPGVDLNLRLSLVPFLNISLVCKEMLSGVWHWGFIAVIFGSMTVYAAIALAMAVAMFKRENVLFRS